MPTNAWFGCKKITGIFYHKRWRMTFLVNNTNTIVVNTVMNKMVLIPLRHSTEKLMLFLPSNL